MKSFAFLVLFFVELQIIQTQSESIAVYAIKSILQSYFEKDYPKVDVIYNGEFPGSVAEEVLRTKPSSIAVQVKKGSSWTRPLNVSTIYFFDSVEDFKTKAENISWLTDRYFRHPHLVYFPNARVSAINETIPDGLSIDNVNFLVNETADSIDLVTCFMFNEGSCRQKQFETVNTFTRHEMRWKRSTFYPRKYQNFHNCSLTFADYQYKANFATLPQILFYAVSKLLNFKPDYHYFNHSAYEEAYDRDEFDFYEQTDNPYFEHITTFPYGSEVASMSVPPGMPYTQWEKMLFPFQAEVWLSIIITLVISFATVQVISLFGSKIRNEVYGDSISSPTMNLLDIFLNGSQCKFPGNYFARILLLLFIFWSLIIRTCYQSELFKNLQSDERMPRVKSFEEMVEKNFTWVVSDASLLNGEWDKRLFQLNWEFTTLERLNYVVEPENKATTIVTSDFLTFVQNTQYRSGFTSLTLLDDVSRTFFLVLNFKPFHPFFEAINEKILQLAANGYGKRIHDRYIRRGEINNAGDEIGPQILTMDQLEVGFLVCLVPMTLSLLAFVAEILIAHCRDRCKVKQRTAVRAATRYRVK